MKLIPLTKGEFVMVDDEDYECLNQFKWYADKGRNRSTFYATRNIVEKKPVRRNIKIQMHRLIMGVLDSKDVVGHKDGNGLNCQRKNLGIVTTCKNSIKRRSAKNSTSKYLGVSLKKDKRRGTTHWRAAVWVNGKSVYEKCFNTEIEAAKSYNEIAKKYHGEFANLNRIEDNEKEAHKKDPEYIAELSRIATPTFGNTLDEWMGVSGYEGLYLVSNLGNVKSIKKIIHKGRHGTVEFPEKLLSPVKSNGYLYVGIYKNKKHKKSAIHRLVATAFIPNPNNKSMVNHKNGIKTDNRADNLEWCTPKENSEHASVNNLVARNYGSKNGHSTLTEEDVKTIRNSRHSISRKKLSQMFKVSIKHIDRVTSGERWGHLK